MWSQGASRIVGVATAVAVGVAGCIDLAKKTQRDWLHWVAVVVVMTNLVLVPLLLFADTYLAASQAAL